MAGSRQVEDGYEPAPLDVAWREYKRDHPRSANPANYEIFRAGYRRGIGMGGQLASTMFVHSQEGPRNE